MKKAKKYQGMILFFLNTLWGFSPIAFATTFGEINLSDQIRNAPYFVHGRIIGSAWVEMDPSVQRPYTYWRLQIIEQFSGKMLGGEITITQPGGEINGLGYHVAGSATFSNGEEVFVSLKETSQDSIKEVIGLSSGKYRVMEQNGKLVVHSALGKNMRSPSGAYFSPEEFSELARRVVANNATESDKKVFLNKGISHDHNPVLEARLREAIQLREHNENNAKMAVNHSHGGDDEKPQQSLTAIQETPLPSEETKQGSSDWNWQMGLALLALFSLGAGIAFLLFKR